MKKTPAVELPVVNSCGLNIWNPEQTETGILDA
jgi:hypothetical protein